VVKRPIERRRRHGQHQRAGTFDGSVLSSIVAAYLA